MGRLERINDMAERKPSKEERQYISKAYKASQVFAIYILDFFSIGYFLMVGAMLVFPKSDLEAQQISKLMPTLLIMAVLLGLALVKEAAVLRNKKAVRKGNYAVIEGMATQYMPYKVPEVTAMETHHERIVSGNDPIKDGKIKFCANDGTQELDWIILKYKSCPKGNNLGSFPVLLIKLQNGVKFAVTDWNKIKNNAEYAHVKPFMILK